VFLFNLFNQGDDFDDSLRGDFAAIKYTKETASTAGFFGMDFPKKTKIEKTSPKRRNL